MSFHILVPSPEYSRLCSCDRISLYASGGFIRSVPGFSLVALGRSVNGLCSLWIPFFPRGALCSCFLPRLVILDILCHVEIRCQGRRKWDMMNANAWSHAVTVSVGHLSEFREEIRF